MQIIREIQKMSITKKIVATIVGLTMVAMVAPSVQGQTTQDLLAQIQQLQQQLAQLMQQYQQLSGQQPSGQVPAACAGITFNRNLSQGMSGNDVKCLQALLNQSADTQVAASGAGSPGNETTYFGSLTKSAVIKFQNKYAAEVLTPVGLTAGTGYVGPKTRAKLNSLLTTGGQPPAGCTTDADCPSGQVCQSGTCVVPSGPASLSVSLAADNPAAATLPDGSLYNPVLKLNFTAAGQQVKVTGITVTKSGYLSNNYVDGVSVWDESGNRLGNIVTALTADSKAIIDFGANDLVVPAGQTKSLTVKVNISGSAGSGTVAFSVASAADITTEGGVTASGSFPLTGNTMGITDGANSLGDVRVSAISVGGLDYSSASGGTSENVSVGDTDVEIAKFRFTQNNSLEAISIEKIVVYVEGTINEDKDLKNFKLYAPNGNLLASAEKAVDRYVTLSLATPYVVDKGLTRDLTLKADVADGSTHWFRAQIQNDYDVLVKGVTTGAYLQPKDSSGSTFDSGDAADSNGYFRIRQGSLTVSRTATSPSGKVSPGDQNIVLAKFDLKAVGEKLEIRRMGLYIKVATTTSGHKLTGTIKVQDASDNTSYISVSADTTSLQGTSAGSYSVLVSQNLSTYLVIDSGQTKTISVIGTIPGTANSTDTYQVYVGGFYAKRIATNDYTTLPDTSTVYSGNELGVGSVSLTVEKNAAFSGKRVAKGSTKAQIGEFVLGASSADDIRVSTIKITCSTTTGVQNVYITKSDNTQLGSTVGTPSSAGNTFTANLTIPKNNSEIIKVFADVTSDFTGSSLYVYIPDSGITGYGVNSSYQLDDTPSSDKSSNSVTVGTPTLTISRDSGAPTSQIITAGKSGVEINKILFEASYEDLTLRGITLQLTSASSGAWSLSQIASNISKVYLYDGSEKVGESPLAGGLAAFTGLNVKLPADETKSLSVKVDITGSGALTSKSVGGIQVYSTSTDYLAVYSSTGIMSSGITLTSNAQSYNFLFTDTAPTVAAASGYSGTVSGSPNSQEIVAKYVVTNNGPRALTMDELRVVASLSNVSATTTSYVTNFRLYDANDNLLATSTLYSDSGFSTAVSNLDGVTNTVYIKFDFDTYETTKQIAANGGSETFVIKANTLNVEAGESNPSTAQVRLTTQIAGEKGYDSSDTTSSPSGEEIYWKDSYIVYKYTPSGGSQLSELRACDSVPVYGATIQY